MSRIVFLEYLKKLYATFSIPQLLTDYGIEDKQLVPPVIDSKKYFNINLMKGQNFTPLWFHDNTAFDTILPEDWLKKHFHNGVQTPVPAYVYLPIKSDDELTNNYKWTHANVIKYDCDTNMYTVALKNNSNVVYPQVPRIQIHFEGEDPREFAKRIKYAVLRRDYCEKMMLWYMYMDKIKIDDVSETLPDKMIQKIMSLVFRNKKIKKTKEDSIIKEIVNNFNRWQYSFLLRFKISKNPIEFKYIEVPDFEFERLIPKIIRLNTGLSFEDFTIIKAAINKQTLLVLPQVHTALWGSNIENLFLINNKQIFITEFLNAVTLEEFESTQFINIKTTMAYLNNIWTKSIINRYHIALRNIKTGWYNISLSNFKVCESSINKLRKLMLLVQYMMEECLRNFVINSATSYSNLIEQPCISLKGIEENFTWNTDLLMFDESNIPPLFSIMLNMNQNGPLYSNDPDKFEPVIVHLFTLAVTESHKISAIHPNLLREIRYFEKPKITSIGLLENEISELQSRIENNVRLAIIPLKAYCKEYIVHLPLFNTNVATYIKDFFDNEPSLPQVKEEISMQFKMKSNLEKTLPDTINIGLFYVRTQQLKSLLIEKRKELSTLLMKTHASKTSEQLELCCAEYNDIYQKLNENPVSIEQLFEMREWIETLPVIIKNISDVVKRLSMELDILDTYLWIVEDDQLKLKLDGKTWPYRIELRMSETQERLDIDFEKFEKLQFEQELLLQETVEYINSAILKLTIETDLTRILETAEEINKLWKEIEKLQSFSQRLNHTQKLFGHLVTPFDNVKSLVKEFEPYKELWLTSAEFLKMQNLWSQNPLTTLDESTLEPILNELLKIMTKCVKQFAEVPGTLSVAIEMKKQIEEYRPTVKLLKDILNPGIKQRHWDIIAKETGVKVVLVPSLNFQKCLELGVDKHVAMIKQISDNASKEYTIELALNKMIKDWDGVKLNLIPHKDTGTYIMQITDEEIQMLDEHILITQQLSFSPFKGLFEEQLTKWEEDLRLTRDVIEAWIEFQTQWMYLEPIFASPDIKDQLPVENKKFNTVQRTWIRIMKSTLEKPLVMMICPDRRLLEKLIEGRDQLALVQKGLTNYLEMKSSVFPRFFFLSDDELLEILADSRNPLAVQPHLKKCFENIYKLEFEADLKVTTMYSGEGESVKLIPSIYPKGTVEYWLLDIENIMRNTIKETLKAALDTVEITPRDEWVLQWPGQVVIAISQTTWTAHVEHGIKTNTLNSYYKTMLSQLNDLRKLVSGNLKNIERQVLSALIVIEVHARDVLSSLVALKIKNVNEFDWIRQLRYYWLDDFGEVVRAVNAQFPYSYEYLGCSGRLVITPLTDRCYLTLTGALNLKFGGAPAGPAGTGKTETTKDLAKALAIQCVVFNCSDQLDYMAMGKFFKGLASSGAWACFDEFNRIDIEVLSVIAQQLTTIQKALMAQMTRFVFEGTEIALKSTCAVFITMNPGYAGRTELPDNLKALFRPVAMMVPDYTLIAEISLFSFGFNDAKPLAGKITTTFKLSSEQLSTQDHYDFGMRAVKTVIAVAGNLKRENPKMDEQQIILRALRDVNVPKFLRDDLTLFKGIVSDLFPLIKQQDIDYGSLEKSIRDTTLNFGLDDVDEYMYKVIQLFETTVVRHGLMLVGPTGSGKTKCYEILKTALTKLEGTESPSGVLFVKVHSFVLNPKSITMGQLYGEFDALTHEWTDGILSYMVRQGISVEDSDKRWYVFDGPVDAVWIENMNSVLDDNKKLCLSSGEIMKITDNQTMIFEVEDLSVASPATVSRCGMVYLEPAILGYGPFINCWCKHLPKLVSHVKEELLSLIDLYVIPAIEYVHRELIEIVISVKSSLLMSCLNLMTIMFKPLTNADNKPIPPPQFLSLIPQLLPCWIVFAIIWSVGVTCDHKSRSLFSAWLRKQMTLNRHQNKFPDEGLIYDYRLHDGGFTMPTDSGEPAPPTWINWGLYVENIMITEETNYSDIEVPTVDNVRSAYIIEMLLTNGHNVLCIGPTGTGKTLTVMSKLTYNMPKNYISDFLNFSARTSVNQTQDLIDSKLDKRRKGVFGPPITKILILFIDDFNMPALETYGAQPPIELIRQWMDFGGWYDRKNIGEWRSIVDTNFIVAMGPPGGGRNNITPRILRHFHYLSFTDMDESSQISIFGQILKSWTSRNENFKGIEEQILRMTLTIYNIIVSDLLPTPAKTHYTFNLRDLSKVFQGILMAQPEVIENEQELIRLWYHENCRVYQDRLINDEDRNWFSGQLKNKILDNFGLDFVSLVTDEIILFSDFVDSDSYTRVTNTNTILKVLEKYLEEYNAQTSTVINLVFFMDAISHVCRITRLIGQQLGNALLLGMGGSGRQSLTRLATYIRQLQLFQIQLTKTYSTNDFREDMKKLMLRAGLLKVQSVFLFSDTQIKSESFLEDINGILNSGNIPNIYQPDELDKIMQVMKAPATELGLVTSKANLFSLYLKRVKINLHSVITMSPIGEIFRSRIRQFPALINNCTIDWFSEWPESALKSVAHHFLMEIEDLNSNPVLFDGIVSTFQYMQQSVIEESVIYLQELKRYIYVTPSSYLELIKCYMNMQRDKKQEINESVNKLQVGLDKLLTTAEEVKVMQKELTEIRPIIDAARIDVEKMVVIIEADREKAEIKKAEVSEVEEIAGKIAEETQQLAMDAQNDLNKALPILLAAEESLKSLNKKDISEIKVLKTPPADVVLVLESICLMKDVKPIQVPGKKLGEKLNDYWEPSRNMLSDPALFLNSLLHYDKENITEATINKIEPYIQNPRFQPQKIAKVSIACTSLCSWVHAIYKYYFINKEVIPKKLALAEATVRLQEANDQLNSAQHQMKEVMDGLDLLERSLNETMNKKNELEAKNQLCIDRMDRALRLVGGLANERKHWIELIIDYKEVLINLAGDILISAGSLAYLTVFTDKYRSSLRAKWLKIIDNNHVSRSKNCSIISILGDVVTIRNWQMAGLPRDNFSTENAILMFNSNRWPLIIDPQGQANRWIKNLDKTSMNKMVVCKLTDKYLLHNLNNAVRYGKTCLIENVGTELDPALDTLFSRATFVQGGITVIQIGDTTVPYNNNFQLFITTNLPNPHYLPEVSIKVMLVNFTLVSSGLMDQLLSIVVMQERPDLEELRSAIVISTAQMKSDIKDIQDRLLKRLTSAEGSPVDDIELIEMLEASKLKSAEILEKVEAAEITQKNIDEIRTLYIPVANRGQLLYFCLAGLPSVDPMYQYSLEWFVALFISSIQVTEKSDIISQRVEIIINHFTFNLYCNVCRSLFERNKIQFAILLCVRIMIENGKIPLNEWTFFLVSGNPLKNIENPAPQWLSDRTWNEIMALENLPIFAEFVRLFPTKATSFKRIVDSTEPHKEIFPDPWHKVFNRFQLLIILKCFRPDKVLNALQDFLIENLGSRYVEPQSSDLSEMYNDSSATTPLIFILSVGTDPAAELYKFAEKMKMTKRLFVISLGQGQGPLAETMFNQCMASGSWVFFQNCHLSPSWMPRLEFIVETIDPEKVHKDFRVWLTSNPSPVFPVSILQNGAKMTVEPPRGIKANLLRAFVAGPASEYASQMTVNENTGDEDVTFKWLLFSLCLFHGVLLERRKYGSLSFNVSYEFTDGDLRICADQLRAFLSEYSGTVPYDVLVYTAGHINYGGRITDDWDRRCLMKLLGDFYQPNVVQAGYVFDAGSGHFRQPAADADHDDFVNYIKTLPVNDDPAIFGLHSNANITYAQTETFRTLAVLLSLQPSAVTVSGGSDGEDGTFKTVMALIKDIPEPWASLDDIQAKYPVMYSESLNTVLLQELTRYNRLLKAISDSLRNLLKGLKGLVVLTKDLEQMIDQIAANQVPMMWSKKGYPSLKPLGAWVTDLRVRVSFLNNWIREGIPMSFWISGFFFPQAFLTGCLQNFARQNTISIDTIQYGFKVLDKKYNKRPAYGCIIHGLFLEGCRWNEQLHSLEESKPKILYSEMPPIWLIPEQNHRFKDGMYLCPVYKTLTRAGTLSTTGHSTNFVLPIEVPSNQPQRHWIKRGVALICALDY